MRINYATQVTRIDGTEADFSDYSGQVLLIVNTASACGYTPQYRGLQALYQRFKDHGFSVLGFPCNQFGSQEPGTADEIRDFCEQKFSVTFPLFAKIDVNGPDTHPLYQQLKSAKPGLLGSQDIKWNFTKFLVSRDGEVQKRYGSQKDPNDLEPAILEALSESGAHARSLWYSNSATIDALQPIKHQPYDNKIPIKTITYMYIANQVQFFL